jgi:LysM repeat protein
MNSTNPFVPQTSLLEQKNKNRARVKVAVLLIFAFNILLISPVLLIQACKRESASTENTYDTPSTTSTTTASNDVASIDMSRAPVLPGPGSTTVAPTTLTASNAVTPPTHTELVTPTGGPSDYVVVKGDNFTTIAKHNNVTVAALRAANPGVVDTKIQVGQKLKIPAPTATASSSGTMMASATSSTDSSTYTVKSGDSLIKIATRFNTTPQALRSLNGLKTDKIYVGNKLKLPVKATPAAAPTTAESSPLTPAGPGPVASVPASSPIPTR